MIINQSQIIFMEMVSPNFHGGTEENQVTPPQQDNWSWHHQNWTWDLPTTRAQGGGGALASSHDVPWHAIEYNPPEH
jgi:hypothetical protein